MKKTTIVYYEGGHIYKGEFELDNKDISSLKKKAKEDGQTSFVTGFTRYVGNVNKKVIVFLSEDSQAKIVERCRNGLINARWYPLR